MTMTGSELAGHRLVESARRAVLRTALLARRGALRHPSIETPHRPALRASSRPSRGGQCKAIGRRWGEATDRPDRAIRNLKREGVAPQGHRLPRGARCDSTVRSAYSCRRRPARLEPTAAVREPWQEEEIRQTPRAEGGFSRPEGVWSAGWGPAGRLPHKRNNRLF